jgi:hypothetical protein
MYYTRGQENAKLSISSATYILIVYWTKKDNPQRNHIVEILPGLKNGNAQALPR